MNSRERVLAMLEGRPTDRLALMPITMMFASRHIGAKYGRYALDHRLLVESQIRTSQHYEFDHVSAITETRDAPDCGAVIQCFEDQPYAIDERCARLADKSALAGLSGPDPKTAAHMSDRLHALSLLREKAGREKIVEGWVEGPCGAAADLRGINTLILGFYDDPDFVKDLFEFVVELGLRFGQAQGHAAWRRRDLRLPRSASGRHPLQTQSTMSICSIEDIAAAIDKPFWFQLYVMKDRGFIKSLIERAIAAKCSALVLTVDLQVIGQRHQDIKNGMTVPPEWSLSKLLDFASKPSWVAGVLRGKRRSFGNIVGHVKGTEDLTKLSEWTASQFDTTLNWKDMDWIRSIWPGKLILKGILDVEDAELAAKTVLTDNGREFCGKPATHPYELLLAMEDIEHRNTRVRTPRTNGFVERMNRTLLDECFRVKGRENWYLTIGEIQRDLDAFMTHYNLERSHQGYRLNGRTPAQALKDALGLTDLPSLRFETEISTEKEVPADTEIA